MRYVWIRKRDASALNLSIARSIKIWLSKEFKQPLFSLTLCTAGDLITGITMGIFSSSFSILPALIVLVPAAIGMRGNIFATLGSRLGTYLHTGQIKPNFRRNDLLNQNVASSFALTLLTSLYIGMLAASVAGLLGLEAKTVELVIISMLAGSFSAVVMVLFTILIAFLSFRRGWDPDNLTTPIITLIGDMLTLPLIFISMYLILDILYLGKLLLLAILLVPIPFTILYVRGREVYGKILRESLPILLVCGLIEMFTGTILGGNVRPLLSVPIILIMLPAFLEDGGAIGGILASRLSSSLHLGVMEARWRIPRSVWKDFITMHILGVVVFSLVGIFAYLIALSLGVSFLPFHITIAISLLGGEMLVGIVNLIAYYISILSFRKGIDPDNVTIPMLTSIVDLTGASCLFIAFIVLQATFI